MDNNLFRFRYQNIQYTLVSMNTRGPLKFGRLIRNSYYPVSLSIKKALKGTETVFVLTGIRINRVRTNESLLLFGLVTILAQRVLH